MASDLAEIWTRLLSPQRGAAETPHGSSRSAFEQDYDRIIFSQPFRRLQDKTQVHPLPEQDFVHTRLTHSLEVSSVGRSLGKKVGEQITQRHPVLQQQFSLFDFGSIVSAASLAHDLGNPPFGHAGESAISDFFRQPKIREKFEPLVQKEQWEEIIRFEGNAQGFRILNKNQYGLKLTFATLGAFTKYPIAAAYPFREKERKSHKKYGYFQAEREKFSEVATALNLPVLEKGGWARHALAFLVEAADDICYSIIDLEDGCNLGLISYADTRDLFSQIISTSKTKLDKLGSLTDLNERTGYLRALAIGDIIQECTEVFLDHEQDILKGTFDEPLVEKLSVKEGMKEIIAASIRQIYQARSVVEVEAAGHTVLPGLLEEFLPAAEAMWSEKPARKEANLQLLFPSHITDRLHESKGAYYHLIRSVIDFVSGLTDRNALTLYQKIKGYRW